MSSDRGPYYIWVKSLGLNWLGYVSLVSELALKPLLANAWRPFRDAMKKARSPDEDRALRDSRGGGLQTGFDELLELHDVFAEVADAFGGLFGGHGVFVEEPAEGFFVAADALDFEGLGGGGVELRTRDSSAA
jgi:hypothetical protein